MKRIVCLLLGHPGWIDRVAPWQVWWPQTGPVPGRHAHWDGFSFIGYCVRCGTRDKAILE